MTDYYYDPEEVTELVMKEVTALKIDEIERNVYDQGLPFDDTVAERVAAAQPVLATYSATVREWLKGGACGKLRVDRKTGTEVQ